MMYMAALTDPWSFRDVVLAVLSGLFMGWGLCNMLYKDRK